MGCPYGATTTYVCGQIIPWTPAEETPQGQNAVAPQLCWGLGCWPNTSVYEHVAPAPGTQTLADRPGSPRQKATGPHGQDPSQGTLPTNHDQ